VIVLSLLPPAALDRFHYDEFVTNDKVGHFAAYTTLALLPVVATEAVLFGLALAASMVPLGVGLEFAQRLVPGRTFDTHDMLANTIGVLTGAILAVLLRAGWDRRFRLSTNR
jgi:VanZ family protein